MPKPLPLNMEKTSYGPLLTSVGSPSRAGGTLTHASQLVGGQWGLEAPRDGAVAQGGPPALGTQGPAHVCNHKARCSHMEHARKSKWST